MCEGNMEEAVKQEEKLCDEVEAEREFAYLGDRVSVGEGHKDAVTARTRCRWFKFLNYMERDFF